jgi:ABC-type transport system involved in cytochrome c biogenesis permease subunit
MQAADIVLLVFTGLNALQIVSYLPQIACVIRDRKGASSISCVTWTIWLAGSAATTAYAMVNIWDPWLALVNAVHTLCCGIVIGLTVWKRASPTPAP